MMVGGSSHCFMSDELYSLSCLELTLAQFYLVLDVHRRQTKVRRTFKPLTRHPPSSNVYIQPLTILDTKP